MVDLLTLIGEMVYVSHLRVANDTLIFPFFGNLERDPAIEREKRLLYTEMLISDSVFSVKLMQPKVNLN